MDVFLNFGFAWISVLIAFLLSIIYVFPIIMKKYPVVRPWLEGINTQLRRHHKHIGIVLVLTGLIHGYFSSTAIYGLNVGTLCWVLSLLLGISWMLRKSLKAAKGWMFYHRALTVLFVGALVWHVIDVGGIQVQKFLFDTENKLPIAAAQSENDSIADVEMDDLLGSAIYKDGVYTGEATGYRPGLKVEVTLKNNRIVKVDVIHHNEVNSRFYARPIEEIPGQIVNKQSPDVDTISGATFTSIGIMNAVVDALSDAIVSGSLPETRQLPSNSGRRRH